MKRAMAEVPGEWREAVAGFLGYLEALGYSTETVKTRRSVIRRFAIIAGSGPDEVATRDLLRFMGEAETRGSKKSRRNTLTSFFKWYCNIEGRRLDNPAATLPSVRKDRPHPMPVPDSAIFKAFGDATASERAMLMLAAECGLRRGEIAQVHSRDVIADAGGGKSLIVHGKGDKQRIVPLPPDLAAYIEAADGWMLPGRFGGHVEASFVSKHVGRLLPPGYSTHKLRHRFATTAYAESHDMLAVSRALGHSSTETTMAYTALPDESLRTLVTAATMTAQPIRAAARMEAPPCRPLPPIAPERPAAAPKRRANGKIRYGYENGNIRRRRKAGKSAAPTIPVLLAALFLSWHCLDAVDLYGRDTFRIRAAAFCERFGIEADGHARRASTLRAAARLMQSAGIVLLDDAGDDELAGHITADAATIERYRYDIWREWDERRRTQQRSHDCD